MKRYGQELLPFILLKLIFFAALKKADNQRFIGK